MSRCWSPVSCRWKSLPLESPNAALQINVGIVGGDIGATQGYRGATAANRIGIPEAAGEGTGYVVG